MSTEAGFQNLSPEDQAMLTELKTLYNKNSQAAVFFILAIGIVDRRINMGLITPTQAARSLADYAVELGQMVQAGELT